MDDEIVEVRVELTSHPDALQRLISLLHRKAAAIRTLSFSNDEALLTLHMSSVRVDHVMACLSKEVLVRSVEVRSGSRATPPPLSARC